MRLKKSKIPFLLILFAFTMNSTLLSMLHSYSGKKNGAEVRPYHKADEITSSEKESKTLLLLIADPTCSPPTQALLFTESMIKHGFVEVMYPHDNIENSDIIWLHSFEMDGEVYSITNRIPNNEQTEEIKKIINKLDTFTNLYTYIIRDDYKYILYLDNHKKLDVSIHGLDWDDFSMEVRLILQELLEIGSPIYPDFGFMFN